MHLLGPVPDGRYLLNMDYKENKCSKLAAIKNFMIHLEDALTNKQNDKDYNNYNKLSECCHSSHNLKYERKLNTINLKSKIL